VGERVAVREWEGVREWERLREDVWLAVPDLVGDLLPVEDLVEVSTLVVVL